MPEVSDSTIKERAAEGRTGNWGEVVTRQPYRKVRLDHLLSKEKKQVRKLVILFSYREIIENTKEIERFQWAYSSAGQSARLISVRSVVRVHLSPFPVAMRLGETPVPIPNTMVKTQEADGTMLETAWESRWLPDYKKRIQETFHKFRQNRIYRNVH